MKKLLIAVFALLSLAGYGYSQIINPVSWEFSFSRQEVKNGENVDLIFKATIDEGFHIYSSDFDPAVGPNVAVFNFNPHPSYKLVGKIKAINSIRKYDDIFGGEVAFFNKKAVFKQTVKILSKEYKIDGELNVQACTDTDGKCTQQPADFEFKGAKVVAVNAAQGSFVAAQSESLIKDTGQLIDVKQVASRLPNEKLNKINLKLKERGNSREPSSLYEFMFLAFGAGLLALLTPCVFPMVPMTVSFFTNSSSSRIEAIKKALIYGFSIVFIYGIIGLVGSRFNGPGFANILATHWAPNLLFFSVFFFFGLSFLGLFEITLPSSFVNKVDAQADKGGMAGVFFMALTLVLVSFSCTIPIVGGILVLAAGGQVIKPVLGMLSYSLAFAVPFTFFAMFPSWLNKLPKSGGWLNLIKVTLGFIELALGLKFLSVADQVYHWNLLDREVYIAIWFVLFIILGIYLLGKIRLPHDSETHVTTVPRLLMAVVSFSFSAYLLPGLFGAPLKALSGYLPPLSTHDFDLPGIIREYSTGTDDPKSGNVLCEEPKYKDTLHLPHGLQGFFDYKQALKCAKEKNLPLFIDFTGHGCVNCREMEANVWSDRTVLNILKKDYLVVALYVDDPMKLPETEFYTSEYDKKLKKTIGAQNSDFQIDRFKNNAQPFYVLLNPFTEEPLAQPIGYESSVPRFIDFLEEGKTNFGLSSKKQEKALK
jgi:thiol:disulfide interchange protein